MIVDIKTNNIKISIPLPLSLLNLILKCCKVSSHIDNYKLVELLKKFKKDYKKRNKEKFKLIEFERDDVKMVIKI